MNYIRIRGRNLRSYHNPKAGQTHIKGQDAAGADDTMPIMGLTEESQSNNKAEDSVLLGASLKASFRKNITWYLDYDCMLQDSDGYKSHMFNVGLQVLF